MFRGKSMQTATVGDALSSNEEILVFWSQGAVGLWDQESFQVYIIILEVSRQSYRVTERAREFLRQMRSNYTSQTPQMRCLSWCHSLLNWNNKVYETETWRLMMQKTAGKASHSISKGHCDFRPYYNVSNEYIPKELWMELSCQCKWRRISVGWRTGDHQLPKFCKYQWFLRA